MDYVRNVKSDVRQIDRLWGGCKNHCCSLKFLIDIGGQAESVENARALVKG